MAVLLQLYAAMTQSGFHDQIKPISSRYQNVGLGDPHSKSPCNHPYTRITSTFANVDENQPQKQLDPESKTDNSATVHNKNKEPAVGSPCQ